MKLLSFVKKNGFVLSLLAAFLLTDWLVARWDPLVHSMRFTKNDFTKTLLHHDWTDSGPVFYGNSAVIGAYIEDEAELPLIEMGLAYGKITYLREILEKPWFNVQDQLVLGIDVHTILDKLDTDPTYPWNRKWYQPYLYAYRAYFQDSFAKTVKQAYTSIREGKPEEMLDHQPWLDKHLYFGQKPKEEIDADFEKYEQLFNWMGMEDVQENLQALEWVLDYAEHHQLDFRVVWMPYNPDYPLPNYMSEFMKEANLLLEERQIPVLDLVNRYDSVYFHDVVHLNREQGAPLFTREVDEWLLSLENSP
ncbi:hypothetical protein [Paenibacillus senegalensis]|uniref:hypothetical protein n=1 Tax=Paenibacillus senegalensis TaxID=1465766 RepID=UPI000287A975|nr:hypothetical protein [Paenibacillus senegalensis]